MMLKKLTCFATLVIGLASLSNPAQATEEGASVYLNGFTGFMAGVVPPSRMTGSQSFQ